jgi:hypothetical protein
MRSTRPGVSPDAEEDEVGTLERVVICGRMEIIIIEKYKGGIQK